jgi:hypothetical protein
MRNGAIILILLFSLSVTPAIALDLYQGQDFWGAENFFDIRTYHESHPGSASIHNQGGWCAGIVFVGQDAELVDKVHITTGPSLEGARTKVVFKDPMVYPWLGDTMYDFSMWYGHRMTMGDNVEIRAFGKKNDPVIFNMEDGSIVNSLSVSPRVDVANPPIPVIKHMAIKKDGELMVIFTAPFDTRDNHIRIRIYNAEGTGAEKQYKYFPPYEIVRNDGTIVPDKMKVLLPAEYAGRIARIEYRTLDDGYMCRGITFFKLPEIEE